MQAYSELKEKPAQHSLVCSDCRSLLANPTASSTAHQHQRQAAELSGVDKLFRGDVAKGTAVVVKGIAEPIYSSQPLQVTLPSKRFT